MTSDEDIPLSSSDKLSDLYSRSDRIDALVMIAKQEYDKNKSYSEIIKRLNVEMTCNWALTPTVQHGYLNAIRTKLENTHRIRLQSDGSANFTEIDNEIINGKSEKRLSVKDLFYTTMRNLEGENKNPVKENLLANELEKTGRFTRDKANELIEKMNTNSVIYQSKPGHYNLV